MQRQFRPNPLTVAIRAALWPDSQWAFLNFMMASGRL